MVLRSRLIDRLNKGMHGKLTLISASPGFGKTTLASEWLAGCERPAAWLSLDKGDNDAARFMTYLFTALQNIGANVGEGVFGLLQSPQPPSIESMLTILLNEMTTIPGPFILVLEDYHVIDAKSVQEAVAFLVERLPEQMHLVIITRKDPPLPLARLRVRGQLNELRVADLRFTSIEAAEFLNEMMGLRLSQGDISRLETRTEGWIAGLQLAAISMQGHKDTRDFIDSFTGSHRFVMDYLIEEVLRQQPESIQLFLLRTSILERMSGSLCDDVTRSGAQNKKKDGAYAASSSLPRDFTFASGQEVLEYLEQANLFIVPLDNERRWYRYHHLFADLLRQRLNQHSAASAGSEGWDIGELHIHASVWYEKNGLEIEAFHHAVAANDIPRATRLMEGGGMPLHFRGGVAPVMNWLESLPAATMNAKPSLLVIHASALLFVGQTNGVEQKLKAAEAALQDAALDDKNKDLIGHIASARATLAVSQHQVDAIIAESKRALAFLHPNNLPVRSAATWALGYANQLKGDRAAAKEAYGEALTISRMIGHYIIRIMATLGIGNLQEAENQLDLAYQTYQQVLELAGDPPIPVFCEAYLGLARISREWNDLEAAEQHLQQSMQLARQIEYTDRLVNCQVFQAKLMLAQGDAAGASRILTKAGQFVRQHNFVYRMPDIAAVQVLVSLRMGNMAAAAEWTETSDPISAARVHLAQGNTIAALALLEPWHQQVEAKGWEDERLKAMALQAVVLYAHGDKKEAVRLLAETLALAEPGGLVRLFIDEGFPMAGLMYEASALGLMPDYTAKLLAVFEAEPLSRPQAEPLRAQPLIEPLSDRELKVLRLIAEGLSNLEISESLFLALSTVKGHNRIIFDKLQVQRRTEAVARARELGLL
jgi:LuxR family maltose regulon positive regulatory protein